MVAVNGIDTLQHYSTFRGAGNEVLKVVDGGDGMQPMGKIRAPKLLELHQSLLQLTPLASYRR